MQGHLDSVRYCVAALAHSHAIEAQQQLWNEVLDGILLLFFPSKDLWVYVEPLAERRAYG